MPTWKAGNKGINWQVTCKRVNGTAINVTGYTVKLQVENLSTGTEIEVTGSLVDAVNGVVSFLIDTTIATAGEYMGEIQLSSGSTYVEDSFTFNWSVQPQVKT